MTPAWVIVVSAFLLITVVAVVVLCFVVSTLKQDLKNLRNSHNEHAVDYYVWVRRVNQTIDRYGREIDSMTGRWKR